jgi:hypothetical protein
MRSMSLLPAVILIPLQIHFHMPKPAVDETTLYLIRVPSLSQRQRNLDCKQLLPAAKPALDLGGSNSQYAPNLIADLTKPSASRRLGFRGDSRFSLFHRLDVPDQTVPYERGSGKRGADLSCREDSTTRAVEGHLTERPAASASLARC